MRTSHCDWPAVRKVQGFSLMLFFFIAAMRMASRRDFQKCLAANVPWPCVGLQPSGWEPPILMMARCQ